MKVSIITACYNAARTIEDTLRSVAAQTHPEIEHIIVDGLSTDGTMAVVEHFRRSHARILSEPDRGIYDAMNKGIALSSGDIVGFLNADDVYADSTAVAAIVEAFANPEVDACHADLVYVDGRDPSRIVRYWKSRDYEYGLFRTGWMPAHPTFFVRRRIFEKYGMFDLGYSLQSDFDLTLRFLEVHRIRSVYIPRVLTRMRTGGVTNKSIGNIIKGNLEAYRACRKNGIPVGPWFIVRKILSRVPQFFLKPPA